MNISGIKFLNPIKQVSFNKSAQNPINFRGGLKNDSFERTFDNSKKNDDEQIIALEDKVRKISREIFHLRSGKLSLREEIRENEKLTSKEIALLKEKCAQIDGEIEQLDNKRDILRKEIQYKKDLKVYEEKLAINPNTAFLYDPNLTLEEKKNLLKEHSEIKSVTDIAGLVHASKYSIEAFIKTGDLIKDDFGEDEYIDTSNDKNKDLIKYIEQNKDTIEMSFLLARKYNINPNERKTMLETGKLVSLTDSVLMGEHTLVDVNNPINKKTLDEHRKLVPVFSFKFPEQSLGDCIFPAVPTPYLVKLGYGQFKDILEAYKDGHIKGHVKETKTTDGKTKKALYIDMSHKTTRHNLAVLKSRNENIIEQKQLLKELGITKSQLQEALLNDECEIIGEFLLDIEKDKTYFDLTNEKNQAFIEKIKLENELQQALKVQRRGIKNLDSSLRMKIAWSLCPKTSMVASQNAMQDGYLAQIFEKLDNDEKLTPKEEVVLKNYYKSVWNCAGTEEFSKACIEASKIMHQLKTEGIESIEDPQILKVINDFYDELENQ